MIDEVCTTGCIICTRIRDGHRAFLKVAPRMSVSQRFTVSRTLLRTAVEHEDRWDHVVFTPTGHWKFLRFMFQNEQVFWILIYWNILCAIIMLLK